MNTENRENRGPGTGLLVWATAGGHGFVVGT